MADRIFGRRGWDFPVYWCPCGEKLALSGREVYIYYPVDIGRGKLKQPELAKEATVRNTNTIKKLSEISANHP